MSEEKIEQVPGECELGALTILRNTQNYVGLEQSSTIVSRWSIANADMFNHGVCGEVQDRTTSPSDFTTAIDRHDGQGFNNPMYMSVNYRSPDVITKISSSVTSAVRVTSFGGFVNVADGPISLSTIGYGQEFFTAHVTFSDVEFGLFFSFPLLFQDSLGCMDEESDWDYYGLAVKGYGEFFGGTIVPHQRLDDDDDYVDFSNTITMESSTLTNYLLNQIRCDVGDEPVWSTDTGYMKCSESADTYNVTTVVNNCPISVIQSRFRPVGDFTNGDFFSRSEQWFDDFLPTQLLILNSDLDSKASILTSTGVVQTTTQVGFDVVEANNGTERILIMVVAIEALLALFFSMIYGIYGILNGSVRRKRGTTTNSEWFKVYGTVFALASILALGLIPVYIGWSSESEAENMAHNDVYIYTKTDTICSDATFGGEVASWCTTFATNVETLIVRSYVSTFESWYMGLAITSTIFGVVMLIVIIVVKTIYVIGE